MRLAHGGVLTGMLLAIGLATTTVQADVIDPRAVDTALPESTPNADTLESILDSLLVSRGLAGSTTAVYLIDVETGTPLFANKIDEPLNPASNVKLISTATVLNALGPDWRYTTRVLGSEPDPSGVITGDVYLRGEGDPTLGPGAIGQLATELRARGTIAIDGDLLIGEDALQNALGGTSLRISVTGGRTTRDPVAVRVYPETDFIKIVSTARTGRSRRVRPQISTELVEDEFGPRVEVRVSGRAPRRRTVSVNRPARAPALIAAHVLRDALIGEGVDVRGRVRIAELPDYYAASVGQRRVPSLLAQVTSPPMSDLVSRVNKRSLNRLADRLVMTAGSVRFGTEPSMDSGIRAMREWLASVGLDPDGLTIDTGSGLSYKTKISARQIMEVLRVAGGYAGDAPQWSAAFVDSLAVGGVDGTLRRRFREDDVRGHVLAKTGTLTGVIALSGFARSKSRTVAFSIVTNRPRRQNRKRVRRDHERIVRAVFDWLDSAEP